MTGFDDSKFYPALAAAGMLSQASTVLPGCTAPTNFYVRFHRPDVNPITGMQAAEYCIDYQHGDAPALLEGAEVIVDSRMYRVRQAPQVDLDIGADGYFRRAYLTRV